MLQVEEALIADVEAEESIFEGEEAISVEDFIEQNVVEEFDECEVAQKAIEVSEQTLDERKKKPKNFEKQCKKLEVLLKAFNVKKQKMESALQKLLQQFSL